MYSVPNISSKVKRRLLTLAKALIDSTDRLRNILRQRPRLERIERLLQLFQAGHAKEDPITILRIQGTVVAGPAERRRMAVESVPPRSGLDGSDNGFYGWVAV